MASTKEQSTPRTTSPPGAGRLEVPPNVKSYCVRFGPNRIFDLDSDPSEDFRKNLPEKECSVRFDQEWNRGLHKAVVEGQSRTYEEILQELHERQRPQIDRGKSYLWCEHGIVKFVVQYTDHEDRRDISKIVWVFRSDEHPQWLIVKFPTKAARAWFHTIAEHLKRDDGDLALELLEDFARKVGGLPPQAHKPEDWPPAVERVQVPAERGARRR